MKKKTFSSDEIRHADIKVNKDLGKIIANNPPSKKLERANEMLKKYPPPAELMKKQ